jgi:hypothetical protein
MDYLKVATAIQQEANALFARAEQVQYVAHIFREMVDEHWENGMAPRGRPKGSKDGKPRRTKGRG